MLNEDNIPSYSGPALLHFPPANLSFISNKTLFTNGQFANLNF